MSLHGLDSDAVTAAYQSALAEAGGWFLLRYASRDAVEVLTRGAGGAAEVRAAVGQYAEKSPLYGLLLYRRRKVLLKCVPAGTSRLLQARVAVHFLAIADRFAPHDLVLAIADADELSDTALAAACTLHTAAPSTSSSSASSRHQKLSWIEEAADEGPQPSISPSEPLILPIPTILEPASSRTDNGNDDAPAAAVNPDPASPSPTEPVPADLQPTLKSYDQLLQAEPEPRPSSQATQPDYNELYEHYYALYTKPKVKLGPRPRQPSQSRSSFERGRPSTSGSASQDLARPVSSLPSGLRATARKTAHKNEPKTRSSSIPSTIAIPTLPPIPMSPDMPQSPMSPAYSLRSPVSVRSMPVSAYSTHHRSTGMTQERTRLMKALELRKKQQEAQRARSEKPAPSLPGAPESPAKTTPAPDSVINANQDPPVVAAHDKNYDGDDSESSKPDVTAPSGHVHSSSAGLGLAGSQVEVDDLHSAPSVSSPVSAQTHGSSGPPSTRPSSLSDNNDGDDDDDDQASLKPSKERHQVVSPDSQDEGQSVESTPTVVPESRTPECPSASDSPTPPANPTASSRMLDSHSNELAMPLVEPDDTRAKRRSKRESCMYIPSGDVFTGAEVSINMDKEPSSMPTNKRQSWYETKDQRRAMLDPLEFTVEPSETEYLSDDSFMEELQTATVHQAQPMSVSKSPIPPTFPRKSTAGAFMSSGTMTPPGTASSYRSMGGLSSGWPPRPTTSETVAVAKKINVSSGISQRIKALAETSSRELKPSPVGAAANSLEPGSTLAQRKSSFFAASPMETTPNGQTTLRITPDKHKAASIKSTKSTVYNVRAAEKSESVQVTARIIRDERTAQPTLSMPTGNTPLELHQSPLIIDHQKLTQPQKSPTRGRPDPASPRVPQSTSHSREHSIAPSRTSSEGTWKAFGRRMSETTLHSHDGSEDRGDEKKDKKDKKDSRTSKMFKRMSSSMPWKSSTSSHGPPEHGLGSSSLFSLREPPSPVHVGELNIQFPDTLLWKRRCVEIDASGNLILSPSRSNEKGIIKRFHLSEFRAPYLPDQDQQELPNSVVLDFTDGRTLQCACETYIAQAQVLQILTEAQDAWLAYNQAT